MSALFVVPPAFAKTLRHVAERWAEARGLPLHVAKTSIKRRISV